MTNLHESRRPSPPPLFASALIASLAALATFAFVRLYLYPDRSVPLTYALPLLLGVWHKNRTLHWILAALLAGTAAVQVFWIFPDEAAALVSRPASYLMMLANIGIVAVVVDRLIVAQDCLRASYNDLEQANHELEASNEELAAREEEVSSQNEELQMQAEELEHQNEELQQQSEELQQQSEELQQQSEELQHLNEEAAAREGVLQALLELAARPVTKDGMAAVAAQICRTSLDVWGAAQAGALVVAHDEGQLRILGHCGVDLPPINGDGPPTLDDPFPLTVIHQRRAAAIEDLATTPEVKAPMALTGAFFKSALAAPLEQPDGSIGALVLYNVERRRWTKSDFKIIGWLAAEAGLVLYSAKLQQELDRRRIEAEEASQRKTRFLAAVSHDVRTPANAISLTAEVIKQAGDDPQWAHEIPNLVEALRSNAKLLVELVSDVLDLARFDSGKVEADPSEFNLQDMVAAELTQYHALAASAGLRLEGSADAASIWVRTDRMKLARVLGNLIGNAIKFTDRGQVDVQCTRSGDGDVEVRVRDTGVGIQPANLEHIFDEFYQIKNPERDRSKGTGLGLAICKRLVDAIGCSLAVRSRFGDGSTFTIRIPQELVIEAPERRGETPQQPQPLGTAKRLTGMQVLLVEDHEDTRTAFARLLAAHGATVEVAPDGREALRILGHHRPDVVLLDLMLPDMDGREVLRRLSANRPASLRCLLAVSGDVTEERRREVESLGADGLVPKPLRIDPLIERIRQHLDASRDEARTQSPI